MHADLGPASASQRKPWTGLSHTQPSPSTQALICKLSGTPITSRSRPYPNVYQDVHHAVSESARMLSGCGLRYSSRGARSHKRRPKTAADGSTTNACRHVSFLHQTQRLHVSPAPSPGSLTQNACHVVFANPDQSSEVRNPVWSYNQGR